MLMSGNCLGNKNGSTWNSVFSPWNLSKDSCGAKFIKENVIFSF